MQEPRLRTVEKYKPPYPLNDFPGDFHLNLARELVYHLATGSARLEGQDWEEIFARVIGADWKPSNVGLDDIVLHQCAWGAKTVKHSNPSKAKLVRLISGRNSPVFSYDVSNVKEIDRNELGGLILSIWNERVSAVKKNYKHLRTVVLIKSDDLLEVAVFETDTLRREPERYSWEWNPRGNLEGYDERGLHKFTWQPHGAQFTIIERVPPDCFSMRIQQPPHLDREAVLKAVNFNRSWITIR
jgi:hypothetical protein